jgi:hypothetical protein
MSQALISARDGALLAAVRERRPTIFEVAHFVQGHPELAYEEYECAKYILGSLSEISEVEQGLAGMPTGFRATLRGAGPGPTVGSWPSVTPSECPGTTACAGEAVLNGLRERVATRTVRHDRSQPGGRGGAVHTDQGADQRA